MAAAVRSADVAVEAQRVPSPLVIASMTYADYMSGP